MKACPITFRHPSEAMQLNGIGEKLSKKLAEEMKQHCEANGLPMPKSSRKKRRLEASDLALGEESPTKKPRKTAKKKTYVPKLRSGPYAMILALSTVPESSSGLTKSQIIEIAQEHCDASFTATSGPGQFHTAWSSMKTLQTKELVSESGRIGPATRKYALSDEGWETARSIRAAQNLDNPSILNPTEPGFMGQGETDQRAESAVGPSPSPVRRQHRQIPQSPAEGASLSSRKLTIPTTASTRKCSPPADEPIEILSSSPSSPAKKSLKALSDQELNTRGNVGAHKGTQKQQTKAHPSKQPSRRVDNIGFDFSTPLEDRSHAQTSLKSNVETISVPPGSFSIELLLDNREVRSRTDRVYIQDNLIRNGVNPTTKPLELGDFVWVARVHDPAVLARLPVDDGPDIILDHVCERKRLDDLLYSIRDGRFQEQKFRLARCGVPNVLYVVEDAGFYKDMKHSGEQKKPEEVGEPDQRKQVERRSDWARIQSGIAATQTIDGFFVKQTKTLDGSIRYLARLTHTLRRRYASRGLELVPATAFEKFPQTATLADMLKDRPPSHRVSTQTFASLVSKSASLTLRDIFLKMLLCTRGVTGDRAIEIQRRWKTPREFVEALERAAQRGQRAAAAQARVDHTAVEAAGTSLTGKQDKARKSKQRETPTEAARRARDEMVFEAAGGLVGRAKIGKAISEKIGRIWGPEL